MRISLSTLIRWFRIANRDPFRFSDIRRVVLQKFGLDSLQSQKHSALGFEIVTLFSAHLLTSTLGLAGKKLRLSIQAFENAKAKEFPEGNADYLIQKMSDNFYELLLQREFVGFIEGNMEWLRKYYSVPDDAISMLGARSGSK